MEVGDQSLQQRWIPDARGNDGEGTGMTPSFLSPRTFSLPSPSRKRGPIRTLDSRCAREMTEGMDSRLRGNDRNNKFKSQISKCKMIMQNAKRDITKPYDDFRALDSRLRGNDRKGVEIMERERK